MIRSDQRYYPDSLISSPERLSLTNDKFLLLKRHPCSKNLSNDLVTEIASQCEVIQCAPGETPQQVNQAFHSVYLMIHGRMRQTLYDFQGRIVAERFQVAGEQFGALAAAMGEPAPMEFADKVLWCVTSENWQQSVAAFQHILETVLGWENKINVVWIAPRAPELNQPVRRNFKLSFETPPAKQSQGLVNGFERVIHQLRESGLVLHSVAGRPGVWLTWAFSKSSKKTES
jgi:hypothetical protein